MTMKQFALRAAISAASMGIVIAGLSIHSPRVQAQDTEAMLSQVGLTIAPVPLNLAGLDQQMVGVGSYLVNAIGDCNGCHTGGGPPNFNYTANGNPYFVPTFFGPIEITPQTKVDPTVYLSGGMDFGPVGTPTGSGPYAGPDIIARNLTPNSAGVPEGGMTLVQFKQILRAGTDFDQIHPTCTAAQLAKAINAGTTPPPVCIPTSPGNTTNGNLLQVMPWPTFSNLTDYDIDSIYAYLSAIPCIDNSSSPPPAGAPNELRNDCGTSTGSTGSVKQRKTR